MSATNDATFNAFAAARNAVTAKIDALVKDATGSGLAALVATMQQARQAYDPGQPVAGGMTDEMQRLYLAVVQYVTAVTTKEAPLAPAQRTIAFAPFQWP